MTPPPSLAVIARSLAEAYALRRTATALLLPASPELRCVNLMCAKVGGGCACRLALSLERMEVLSELDVSANALDALPDAAWASPGLRELRAAGNRLTTLPPVLSARLRVLDVRDNRIAALPWDALAALPALERLGTSGNPLVASELEAGRALLGARVTLF